MTTFMRSKQHKIVVTFVSSLSCTQQVFMDHDRTFLSHTVSVETINGEYVTWI